MVPASCEIDRFSSRAQKGENTSGGVFLRFVMGVLGFIVANFIFSRVNMRTRLGLIWSGAATLAVLILFTYLATYYMPPEGLDAAEAAQRVAEMNARRVFLIGGEIAGMAYYSVKVVAEGRKGRP